MLDWATGLLYPSDRMAMEVISNDEQQRLAALRRRWLAYSGQRADPARYGASALGAVSRINKAAVVINKSASFLFSGGIDWQTDDETATNTPEEAHLARVWDANDKDEFLHRWALSGGIFGHSFIKLETAAGGGGEYGGLPRLSLIAPEYVVPSWDARDYHHTYRYRIQWTGIDRASEKPIVYRQVIEEADSRRSWTITDSHAFSWQRGWTLDNQTTWPYPWAPIFDTQNLPNPHEYYGEPDCPEDLLNLQDELNWSMQNMREIEYLHGHPKTWAKGVGAPPSPSQKAGVDEGRAGLISGPRDIIMLPTKDSEIGVLPVAENLAPHLSRYDKMEDALHERARVPSIATGKATEIGNLSGRALYILYQPLIELTETKRRLYGGTLRRLNRALLELAGLDAAVEVRNVWPELLPNDPVEERNAALLDQQLGVSKETILTKLGYDPAVEATRRAQEQADAVESAQVAFDRGQPLSEGASAADAMRSSGAGG